MIDPRSIWHEFNTMPLICFSIFLEVLLLAILLLHWADNVPILAEVPLGKAINM